MPNAPLWDPPLIWYWFPITSLLVKSWMNWSLLNPKDNIPTHYLFYISTLTNWRLRFYGPPFWPWNPFGKLIYLGKCNHLPKVAWGNPSLSAYDYHNWSTWPSISPISFFSLLAPYLTTSPCYHEALIYLGPICICPNLCLYYLGWHCWF